MASRWGAAGQEAKERWDEAQSALDCEQQLQWGFAFCRGDSPGAGGSHAASGLGRGSQDIPHLLALCPGSLCVP